MHNKSYQSLSHVLLRCDKKISIYNEVVITLLIDYVPLKMMI